MTDSSRLIESLYKLSDKSPKLVKHSVYNAPEDKNIEVTSWKMNEFKYYDVPSPFPTLARGLFTMANDDKTDGTDIKYRIVARGYDKFFNIGEVPWTNWMAIERHTVPPYTMTLKSNGCIIFIAALSPEKLLVTSKHSIGPVGNSEESHAQVGDRWLTRHLEQAGKTREQLAARLWEKRWTAVAELCDDSFEEHVLPISKDMSGLHLHGLNANVGDFNTQAQPVVDAFAEEWGFIKTASVVIESIEEVREFTQETGKTGMWNGEAVEGFVVRTTIGPRPGDVHTDTPPYEPSSSFFFKIKFDEPYMMYRDWRELTKSLLAAKAKGNIANAKISKARLRRKETLIYKNWVEKEIMRNPKAFEHYQKNRGIIAVREDFLKWFKTPEGQQVDAQITPATPGPSTEDKKRKVVLVPIAVPGCGKTTIAVALSHLFGFGHAQSDNFKGKKPAIPFQKAIANILSHKDVVIADRNNHLKQHRMGIKEAVSFITPPPRLIALNWNVANQSPAIVHRIVTDRIVERGDNHQNLTPNKAVEYEDIIWGFLKDSNELEEDEVDDVIEMEVDESLENALARAVNGVVELLDLEKPSDEKMGEALRIAIDYKPAAENNAKQELKAEKDRQETKKGKEPSSPRYYALLPEIDLKEVVQSVMNSNAPIPDEAKALWEHLKEKNRITQRPHVTITHVKSREHEADAWKACEELTRGPPSLFGFKLGHLVWNERVMAFTIEDLSPAVESGGEDAAQKFLNDLMPEIKNRLHITVGTSEPSVPPVEAKLLVEHWRAGGGDVGAVAVEGVTGKGRIKGLIG